MLKNFFFFIIKSRTLIYLHICWFLLRLAVGCICHLQKKNKMRHIVFVLNYIPAHNLEFQFMVSYPKKFPDIRLYIDTTSLGCFFFFFLFFHLVSRESVGIIVNFVDFMKYWIDFKLTTLFYTQCQHQRPLLRGGITIFLLHSTNNLSFLKNTDAQKMFDVKFWKVFFFFCLAWKNHFWI